MSFIRMVKVFLKSLLFLSLIFLLSPYSTPFLEILQHMWAFGRRKLQWLIKRIVCLLWGAPWGPSGLHTEAFDPRKFISSRCSPHSHLSAMSLFIMLHKNQYPRPTALEYSFPEWSVTESWHVIEPLDSPRLRNNDGKRLTLRKAELGLFEHVSLELRWKWCEPGQRK